MNVMKQNIDVMKQNIDAKKQNIDVKERYIDVIRQNTSCKELCRRVLRIFTDKKPQKEGKLFNENDNLRRIFQ